MKFSNSARHQPYGAARVIALMLLVFGLVSGIQPDVRAAGSAQVVITSLADDGSTPLSFARFQVIDGDGIVLATRESEPVTGIATIDFELGDEDIDAITALDKGEAGRMGPNPDDFNWIPD